MCERIAQHLRENYAQQISKQEINDSRLGKTLKPILKKAKILGFLNERDLRICAEGCAVLGIGFLDDPEHRELRAAIEAAESGEMTALQVDDAMLLRDMQFA